MNPSTESVHVDAPPRPSTYPENVPRPADPPPPAPDHMPSQGHVPSQMSTAPAPTWSWWSQMWSNMGRDAVLVVPGLLISVIAMPMLIALFSISLATFIIWIGALLLPLTLFVASGFANLSRFRARQWGAQVAEVEHRQHGSGIRAWMGAMADGQRWLDLLFETVFALPIRIFTFSVVVPWFFGALGGLTFFIWGRFLPDGNTDLVELIAAAWNDTAVTDLGFGVEATFQFVSGLILLITFPFVLHAMARLEIAAITAGLATGHSARASATPSTPGTPGVMGAVPGHTTSATRPDESPPGSFLTRSGTEGWFWLFTIFIGIVLVAISWPVMAVVYETSAVLAMLVAFAQSAALVLAVRTPIIAIVVGVLSSAAGINITAETSGLVWPWAVTSILALLVLHLIIGLRHNWLRLVILWSLSSAVGAISLGLPHAGGLAGAQANVITTVSLTAGVSIIAVIGNLWIRGRSQLATERQLSAEELAKRQELEERNRIAQELHDVVAHSMSVISVQATTARYRLPELDERSLDEFDSIAGSARQALTEMRGLLAILRGGRDADLTPQPVVDDIPGLVEATRGSGAKVGLEFPDHPIELSPTTGLTAFRVVQEGLSNALRHAPGAPMRVSIRTDGSQLSVAVINGTPEPTIAPAAQTSAEASPAETSQAGPGQPGQAGHIGAGFGLKGMRERVEALNGTLQVGPTPEGGFEVFATLPTV